MKPNRCDRCKKTDGIHKIRSVSGGHLWVCGPCKAFMMMMRSFKLRLEKVTDDPKFSYYAYEAKGENND